MYRPLILACAAAARVSGQSLASVLEDNSDTLSMFTNYVQQAGLLDTLNSLDSATIFAPTNDAFGAALEQFPDLLVENDEDDDDDETTVVITEQFLALLQYHVIPGASLMAADIAEYPGSFYATAYDGVVVNPYAEDGGVKVFSAEKRISQVQDANLEYDGGVIHTIGSALVPPAGPPETVLDLGLTYLYGALQQTDLVQDLNTSDTLTVFVPTNQAFIDIGSALADLSEADLTTILQFHVAPGTAYYTTNITDGAEIDTLANAPYSPSLDASISDDGGLFVSNARVITPNILLRNGVAHLIDQVLNPQEDDDAYGYTYNLNDGNGLGVPGFEDASSATVPALTSGVPSPTNAFVPTATFSQASGASDIGTPSVFGILPLMYAALMALA